MYGFPVFFDLFLGNFCFLTFPREGGISAWNLKAMEKKGRASHGIRHLSCNFFKVLGRFGHLLSGLSGLYVLFGFAFWFTGSCFYMDVLGVFVFLGFVGFTRGGSKSSS